MMTNRLTNQKKIINASEPYTRIGGSLMSSQTLSALTKAGSSFVDTFELYKQANCITAELTKNEGALITNSASAGLILCSIGCLCGKNEERHDLIPDTRSFEKNEIIILDGNFRNLIPYWKLLGVSGAKIVPVKSDPQTIRSAINSKTAAICLFPGELYEQDILTTDTVIPLVKSAGIKIIVDAAAQLPPVSNLWYYTRVLGADLCVFSGGKHIKGPQTTGVIVGKADMIEACELSNYPNPRLGRAFKLGKEEIVAFVSALEQFVNQDDEESYARQKRFLLYIENEIRLKTQMVTRISLTGRLGTQQPLLYIELPEGLSAKRCNYYSRSLLQPVDLGVLPSEAKKPENLLFISAYNLQEKELDQVVHAVVSYVLGDKKG